MDDLTLKYNAGPSTDATLSGIAYNGTAVPGFAADKTAYEVELPAGTTTPPTVTATTTDANATTSITQADALPGKATIDVTAEDGTTKKQYTVTFTVETANPKVETATWANIRGTAEVDNVNMTITGQVLNGKSLTLEPQFTGKYLNSYTPTGAQDFSKGSIDYIFSSTTNEKTTYKVTITEAPAMSSDASLKSLTVTGYNINFSPTTYVYNVEVSGTTVPAVTYVLNDSKATAVKTDATGVPGVTKIVVTAEDGTTTATYTINFTVKVPSSSLTIHEPGIYEARTANGGYGEPLTVLNGREYEVYFLGRDGDKNAGIFTKSGSQIGTGTDEKSLKIEWLSATSADGLDGSGREGKDEFAGATGKGNLKMKNGDEMLIHIKGFDQFTLWGKDNNTDQSKGKYFYVYIDNIEQPVQNLNSSDGGSIRRYDISSGEHVIKITSKLDGVCKPYGFSLRIPDQPKTSYLKGNDSTQNVRQTTDIAPITYFTKYASKGETKLVWDGNEATGFELTKKASSDIGDTIRLTGKALCPVGTYTYRIVNYKDGAEVNSLSGKLSVKSEIVANGVIDVNDAVRNEPITPVNFTYYALSADAVTLTWTGQTPAGLSGAGADGKYAISGTPTAAGKYTYNVSVKDGNTITGTITVESDDLGANPVLFLCKDKANATNDGLYTYLTGKGMNLKARTTLNELRTKSQYDKFEWILISETVDANNGEVLEIIRNGAGKPVLNMKGFTYAPGRLDSIGWGEPDNGTVDSITKNWQNIYVQREDHPIFKAINKNKGEKIQVLSALSKNKGLMPINIKHCDGSLCLATAYTRSLEDYNKDGELQTIIHEIPAAERPDNTKYICFPIAQSSSGNLTTDGVKLIDAIIAYLLDNQPTVALPELKMTGFILDGVKGEIDQENNVVEVHINTTKHPDFNIEKAKPQITLADSRYTFTIPSQNDSVNFSTSFVSPVIYEVTDYINRRPYEIIVYANSTEDIDQTYTAGEWVNIYDIYGRMITTTNQDIYQMELPHGIYIVVTANGGTLKFMR
ncbi:MAG: cadherin-like beta sandwich domain-containing protein [Paludibacteraceae bacterium]|nr:cadherin-like beta sandwich domain-containing protein [Paludibacteraceae bacterium]